MKERAKEAKVEKEKSRGKEDKARKENVEKQKR